MQTGYAFLLADLSQVWPEANQHFSKEIDDEANSYFQRIYNHPPHPTMSVDEVRSLIQASTDEPDSPPKRDHAESAPVRPLCSRLNAHSSAPFSYPGAGDAPEI